MVLTQRPPPAHSLPLMYRRMRKILQHQLHSRNKILHFPNHYYLGQLQAANRTNQQIFTVCTHLELRENCRSELASIVSHGIWVIPENIDTTPTEEIES